MTSRHLREPIAATAILAALVMVFFWRVLLAGETPVPGRQQWLMEPWRSGAAAEREQSGRQWDALLWDAMGQYVPWRIYAARTLRTGELPLWNPHQFCGTPFIANAQSAVFYPPNLLFILMDPLRALGISAALHFLLAGACMYALLRRMALQPTPALLGAVSFIFGGFLVTWTELPALMNTAAWLPCCLLAAHAFFGDPRWPRAALLAGALAMAFLAGHPQIFMYVAGTTLLYCLARLGKLLAANGARATSAAAAVLLAAVVLAGLLCAVQALPTAELAQRGHRGLGQPGEGTWQSQVDRALTAAELPALLVPDIHGSPAVGGYQGLSYTEHCGFVGCTVLALALVAPFVRRGGHALFFAGLSLGTMLVATATPVGRLLFFAVPGFGAAGSVTRVLCVFTFSTAALGAMGLDGALRAREDGALPPRRALAAAVVLAMGVLACGAWFVLRPGQVTAAGGSGAWWPGVLPLVAACATAWVLWVPSVRLPGVEAGLVIIVLVLSDLFNYGVRFNPTAPRAGVYARVAAIETLQREQKGGRVLGLTRRVHWRLDRFPKAVLPPNSAMVYGLRSVQGYDSLSTARYRAYAQLMEGAQPSPVANGNMVLLENAASPLLDRAGVRVVMSVLPLLDEHFELVWTDGHLRIYRNRRALPRAYAAADATILEGSREGLDALAEVRPEAAVRPLVQLGRWDAYGARPGAIQRPAIEAVPIVADRPNSVTLALPEPMTQWAGWLVLADAAYPGWRCYVGDERRPILFADYLFRAVELDGSAADVRFVYMPQSFALGAFLACVGMAALTATLVCWIARSRRGAKGGER